MKVGISCRGLQTAIDNPCNRALNTPSHTQADTDVLAVTDW